MKKRRCVIISFLLVFSMLFVGCDDSKIVAQLTDSEYTVSFQRDDEKISGTLFYHSPNDMKFTIINPKEISGTTLSFDDGKTSASYDSVEIDLSTVICEISELFSCLGFAGSGEILISSTGKTQISSQSENGECSLVFDGESQRITSVEANGTVFLFQ